MDRGRGRGRRYDDRDTGYGGQAYRPQDRMRSPPRHNDSYRGPRSPPRRARTPPYENGFSARGGRGRGQDRPRSRSPQRRRSRSPITSGRDDEFGYRGRARSPPRGPDRARSPPSYPRQSRSPYGGRSRAMSPFSARRVRELSPPGTYRQQSPPKQGRFGNNAEREDYGRRSYPTARDEPRRFQQESNYRPGARDRSPPRVSNHTSRGASVDSRHSSGPGYADRIPDRVSERFSERAPDRLVDRGPDRMMVDRTPDRIPDRVLDRMSDRVPDRMADRPRDRSPPSFRPRQDPLPDRRSPPRHPRDHSYSARQASPPSRSPARRDAHEPAWRDRSPALRQESGWADSQTRPHAQELPTRDQEPPRNGATPSSWSSSQMATPSNQTGDSRPPPTGPSSRFDNSSRGEPNFDRSIPVHSGRGPNVLSAPTRPRDSPDNSFRSRDVPFRGDTPYRGRGGRHFNSGASATPRNTSYDPPSIPTGPRASAVSTYPAPSPPPSRYDNIPAPSRYESGPPSRYNDSNPPPPRKDFTSSNPTPFRPNNSSSSTYPRTQRFNTASSHTNNVLSVLPTAIEGGKKAPSALDPSSERKLIQLEDETRRLKEELEEKLTAKRKGLKVWDKLARESKREGERSELAEGHLDRLGGGGMGGGAY